MWDYLISTLPKEDTEGLYSNISALYIDDKGIQYDITSIDPTIEIIKNSEPFSKTITKHLVSYNDKMLDKYTTSKVGYKVKLINGKCKERRLSSLDKIRRNRYAKIYK